ncbi:hypothetical protein DID88_004212 [Monilinia fructigena]|uniref:Uncharacterized protein n=1 Tax=Monilinia fructigena TaxID=38457 RepID=A0A395IFL4_9HELO|nr:hypothetical protein DID88_002339 [Monilinia fructigena]RAL58176.1 hypothetical protein DID88_002346 [Monilinia fructigena]RAL60608.1 hypothetical protein DID88_009803 [Monilinia fructigena]RAL62746.1 hypothetical protein DID88_004588 [Monilinia fructigena]RAL63130.1 hypothetical protein DID88_004212 [Monilinia fructigena]
MIKEHRIRCEFLWISNTDYSFGGTSGWKERITQLVDEPEPRFLQTSLMEPHTDLRNVIRSFFADISKNNQFATDNLFIDNHNSSRSDITTFEVSKQLFEGPWINGSAITESRTHWETPRDGLDMEPQIRSWVGGRDDAKEKSQELAAVKRSALWGGWSFGAVQGKGDAAESHIALQGLNSGKSDDEVREILAQGDCIPSTTREKSTNKENSSVSNETSGWDTDDEVETWVEWRASWSTSVQWLRRFCFGCVDRR